MKNIPYYRAVKLGTTEYVVGCLIPVKNKNGYFIRTIDEWVDVEIDPTTLAIHFPNMLDSQGNKIFASLSKDGKGGDLLENGYGYIFKVNYKEMINFQNNPDLLKTHKIVGIQQ